MNLKTKFAMLMATGLATGVALGTALFPAEAKTSRPPDVTAGHIGCDGAVCAKIVTVKGIKFMCITEKAYVNEGGSVGLWCERQTKVGDFGDVWEPIK